MNNLMKQLVENYKTYDEAETKECLLTAIFALLLLTAYVFKGNNLVLSILIIPELAFLYFYHKNCKRLKVARIRLKDTIDNIEFMAKESEENECN